MARILIAGCGDVGTALGVRLAADGHNVWGLRRRVHMLPSAIRPLAADLTEPATLQPLPPGLDCVFYTAAADGASDEAYRAAYVDGLCHVLNALHSQQQKGQRIFFTSSTGVYAQSAGEWVDEQSPTNPTHFSGIRMLEGERLLLDSPFPATVLRLGGIYGPGRTRLIEQVRQGRAVCPAGPPHYTNRIHRDDCTGALCHLMTLAQPDTLYLGVDHDPAEQGIVLRWLAERLGVPQPRVETGANSGTRRQRSNKRCCNAKLVATGYVFRYPSFREGYTPILADILAQAEKNGGPTQGRSNRSETR